ncbi:hypothetical protein [Halomonas sp. I5-271120]|uniref:hypothetical protein n=1 Tax=Halomonas sp. I5-271120 TaxID=3061632 RepID=UPI002714FA85|nr:hypothetical protein [Halomonas sp. I5-271120]
MTCLLLGIGLLVVTTAITFLVCGSSNDNYVVVGSTFAFVALLLGGAYFWLDTALPFDLPDFSDCGVTITCSGGGIPRLDGSCECSEEEMSFRLDARC